MRIAMDMQACQTESRRRGIGRYAMELTRAVARRAGHRGHDLHLGIDGTYPEPARSLEAGLEGYVRPAAYSRYVYPGPNQGHGTANDALRPAASALIRAHYRRLAPQVLHVHSIFEGYVEHAACLGELNSLPGTICSATLYDLIPLKLKEHYLAVEDYRQWYERKLKYLAQFDTLLCISEATRKDAIDLLGLEPDRLYVIHAGVDSSFEPKFWPEAERRKFLGRFGILDRFVLFTGNDDPRKNTHGAIESFATIPRMQRDGVQLVLNQVEDEKAIRAFAKRVGLRSTDLVITGHVSDSALVGLLQTCEVFFFPSLYEGFGLPVLEAMACGAPCIAGRNSSLIEIIDRPDALFDASSVQESAALLQRVLSSQSVREELKAHGMARAASYSWDRTAELAISAWEEARSRKAGSDISVSVTRQELFKLAIVTPLPPERTGIADYMAVLAPEIQKYCAVDYFISGDPENVAWVNAQDTSVYPWYEFEEHASAYDHVLYQVGNSPFHSHMLGMLQKFPGTVVLHDLFLSAMLNHMEQVDRAGDFFTLELERSHGRGALEVLAKEGRAEAINRFPCSRMIFDQSTAIVSHSKAAIRMAMRYFPDLRRRRVEYVPMPISARVRPKAKERASARSALGVKQNEFLVVSFGFLADTKRCECIIQAAKLSGNDVRLVFVGENEGADYGEKIATMCLASAGQVKITGFVSAEIFQLYAVAADCAVQLRAMSRGESSKTVLDCLAAGIPTIVNDYGPFRDLPDGAVLKVAQDAGAEDIANAIEELKGDAGLRRALITEASAYVEKIHSPDGAARSLMRVIRDSARLSEEAVASDLVSNIEEALALAEDFEQELNAVGHALESSLMPLREPRLFIDLSEVVDTDYGTGIHRVVRNVTRELMLSEGATELRVVPVAHADTGLVSAAGYCRKELGLASLAMQSEDLSFTQGDILLLLDSAWDRPSRFDQSIQMVREAGGRVGAVVYDLIPLRFPHYCVDFMPSVFEDWLSYVARKTDFIICISKSVADDLRDWIIERELAYRPGLKLGYFHLGANMEAGIRQPEMIDAEIHDVIMCGDACLMSGTLEPRKRHDVVLEAFETLWKKGSTLRLVIIGRQGWNVDDLSERIRFHPERGQRLFWFENASDSDLRFAYANARCLIQASDTEGFGLPIVEAATQGLPLVLSDIPVFREIAGVNASYFTPGDSQSLFECLVELGRPASSAELSWLTWRESAKKLQTLLLDGGWTHVMGLPDA